MPRRVPNRRTQSVETMLALVLADEYTFLTFRQHDGSRDNYPATPWYSAVPIIEIRVRFVDNGSMVLEARFHNVNHAEYSVWRALGVSAQSVRADGRCGHALDYTLTKYLSCLHLLGRLLSCQSLGTL